MSIQLVFGKNGEWAVLHCCWSETRHCFENPVNSKMTKKERKKEGKTDQWCQKEKRMWSCVAYLLMNCTYVCPRARPLGSLSYHVVEATALRHLQSKCLDTYMLPSLHAKLHYCVSRAIHSNAVRNWVCETLRHNHHKPGLDLLVLPMSFIWPLIKSLAFKSWRKTILWKQMNFKFTA